MVALSPEKAEGLEKLRAERKLSFPILVDHENRIAQQLGIKHLVPDDLKAVYQSFGIDLEQANGEGSWTLPMPARFVVDSDGTVLDAAGDPDYTVRPEPDELIALLD